MKNRSIVIIIYIFCLFAFLFEGYCQDVTTSTNKNAIKEYKKAYKELFGRNFENSIIYAKNAIKIDPAFVEAYIMIAENYSLLRDCENA